MTIRRTLAVSLLCVAATLPALSGRAVAAEAYDNCTGIINSVPAVIASQGTWCMNKDLSTALTNTVAVEVSANNVTIDCNGFKLGGLGAGLGTLSTGVRALGRSNTTLRGCNIRGFAVGADLNSVVGGYVVEDNKFESNTVAAVKVVGEGSRIRRNQVLHTGGSSNPEVYAVGIYAEATMDISDNQVVDVAIGNGDTSIGIWMQLAMGGRVARNRVSGVVASGRGTGIYLYDAEGTVVRDNEVTGPGVGDAWGIDCEAAPAIARGNTVTGHQTGLSDCTYAADNFVINFGPP